MGARQITIDLARTTIKEALQHSTAFPASDLINEMKHGGRVLDFDDAAIERFLDLEYRRPLCHVALTLLYDQTDWESAHCHKDYVFPHRLFNEERLRALAVPLTNTWEFIRRSEKIANLVLLSPDEYHEKSELDFFEWAVTRDEAFFERHLLPKEKRLYEPCKFLEFMSAREELIAARLANLFASSSDSAAVKLVA